MTYYLHYSAISDVGRVRRENQDSGYAGPWLLTVCDGVGGAVRGDLASSTAVQALRKLDQEPDEYPGQDHRDGCLKTHARPPRYPDPRASPRALRRPRGAPRWRWPA